MQPGELRNRIEIQRLTKTQGIYGDTKISFLPLKKVWAKVNGLHGKEYWEAKAVSYTHLTLPTIA